MALAICLMFSLVFLVQVMQAPTARSWGWTTHYFIETKAEGVLSNINPFLSSFFSTYHNTLQEWCTKPDSDKSFMPDGSGEADWHYLDADSRGYDPLPYQGKYDGELPWAMKWIFDDIVQYLKDEDWVTAAELMGAICHFAGDATNPLHSTYDYNPGGSGHSAYEDAVNSHIGEMSIPTDYVPQYLDDITNAALVTLAGSFDFTDEDPNGGVNIDGGTIWNDTIKSISENRVRAGVQFTVNVWYTAMVQAGLAGLTSSVDAITPYWANSIPFTITATASENPQSVSLYYRYSTNNSSWGGWTFFENDYSSPYSWSFTAPQGDGYYEFYSIAKEGDDVESPPAVADATCGLDRVLPASSINVISAYWQISVPFNITATASDATSGVKSVLFYYRRSSDNVNWNNWALYGTATTSPYSWSFTAPSGNGHYEFYSIVVDMANGVEQAPTTADARCGVDSIPPVAPAKISPADGAEVNDNTPTFTWSAVTDSLSGIAGYELWVDGSPDFSSPEILENTIDNVTTSYTSATELVNGNYSWRVRAWDKAGNPSPFEQAWIFTISTTPSVVRRGVEVSISPSSRENIPGGTLTYTVTVTNTGNVTDDYNLGKTDNRGWNLTLPPSIAGVVPGRDRRVTLTVGILNNAANGDLSTITVTATSSENTEVENSASCTARCVKIVTSVTSMTVSPFAFPLFPGYSGQVQALTATLRVGNNPLPNKQITWSATAGSVSPSSGTTDALGQVYVVYTAPAVTDNTPQVTITASFAGDNLYQSSSGTSLGIPAVRIIVTISSAGGTVVVTVIETDVDLLVVPENALSENTAIDVVQKPPENLPTHVMVSNIFDIGPNETNFNTPSTLTLPYNENKIPRGMSEDNFAIYRRTSGGGWELVGGNVDKATNTISVKINHLSEYAVMASIGGSAAESGGLPWLTIGVIIAVILIVAVIAIFIRRR
jgi:hypothetical protein